MFMRKGRIIHWVSCFKVHVTMGITVKRQEPVSPFLCGTQDHSDIFKTGNSGTRRGRGLGYSKMSISHVGFESLPSGCIRKDIDARNVS